MLHNAFVFSIYVVSNIIEYTGNQTTTSSITVMINYDLSIITSGIVDVRFIGTPTDVRLNRLMHIMQGPITTQSTSVVFTNLNASTAYTFVIEAVSRGNSSAQIGVGITNLLLQTDPGTLFVCLV